MTTYTLAVLDPLLPRDILKRMSEVQNVSSVPLYWSKVILPVWTSPRGDTGLNR